MGHRAIARGEPGHGFVPGLGHPVEHRLRIEGTAGRDQARGPQLQRLRRRSDHVAGGSNRLEPFFTIVLEPAKIRAAQLERGATLPQRREGVAVELFERSGRE